MSKLKLLAAVAASLSINMPVVAKDKPVATRISQPLMLDEQLQRLDAHFEKRVQDGKRAGYVMLIARDGKMVHSSAIGMRDIATKVPMTMDTRFRIASMTKPVVSAAALILVERGMLQLDDPVARYLPEFADVRVGHSLAADGTLLTVPAKRPITVRDLLSHRAGLGAGGQPEWPATAEYVRRYGEFFAQPSLAETSRWIASLPLTSHPGEAWGYSFSVDVLGRLIEVRMDRPLPEALDELLLSPLGMTDTFYNVRGADHERLATLYVSDDRGSLVPEKDPVLDRLAFPMSGGGLISTAPDYMKFLQMLLNEGQWEGRTVMSPASVKALTTNILPKDQRPVRLEIPAFGAGFGLGVAVVTDDPAGMSLLQEGDYFWIGATDTIFFVSPSRRMAAVMLSQYWPNPNMRDWSVYDFVSMASGAAAP